MQPQLGSGSKARDHTSRRLDCSRPSSTNRFKVTYTLHALIRAPAHRRQLLASIAASNPYECRSITSPHAGHAPAACFSAFITATAASSTGRPAGVLDSGASCTLRNTSCMGVWKSHTASRDVPKRRTYKITVQALHALDDHPLAHASSGQLRHNKCRHICYPHTWAPRSMAMCASALSPDSSSASADRPRASESASTVGHDATASTSADNT